MKNEGGVDEGIAEIREVSEASSARWNHSNRKDSSVVVRSIPTVFLGSGYWFSVLGESF
ncbi:MAG: hypothetical protein WC242_00730 [Candidatus Paceibacterota bacterium]|jgi:hypothetical protein